MKGGDSTVREEMDPPRKDDMPDLLRLDSAVENGGVRPSGDGNRTPSPSGPVPDSQSKPLNGETTQNGPTAPDAKKKIPVESLSKDELVVQVKKQMLLLQKTKARYDELQKKYTDLEQATPSSAQSAGDTTNPLLEKITALEAELRQEREQVKKAQQNSVLQKPQQNSGGSLRSQQTSVAELELRDYVRTIAQLNEKAAAKDDCILRITEQLHNSEQLLMTKHHTIQEQTHQLEEMTRKTATLEGSLSEALRECVEREKVISTLRDDVSARNEKIGELEKRLNGHSEEQEELVRNVGRLRESAEGKERLVQQKNGEISRLTVDLSHARGQCDGVLKEFEEYKVRAQALLRQKDNATESAKRQKEMEEMAARVSELENEVESGKKKLVNVEDELRKEKWTADALKRSSDVEKMRWEKTLLECEVKIRSLETAQESTYQDQRRKIKTYEAEITTLKDLHGSTNEKLLDELRLLRAQNEQLRREITPEDNSDKADMSVDELRFTRSKSEDYPSVRSRSDSSESSPVFNRTISVSASETQPFEKLLSLPLTTTVTKDVDEKRMTHLSELLHESECTNVRLSDQIRLLKTELRRVEANTERDKHVNSMEYLKNVLMQFLTHRVAQSEQEKLIEVMTTILKLTTEERQQLMKAASASYIPQSVKSWGTYLNPWKAKDDG